MVVERLTAYEDAEDDSVGSGVDATDDVMLEVNVDVSNASGVVLDVDTDDSKVVPLEVTSEVEAVVEEYVGSDDEGDDSSDFNDIVVEDVTNVVASISAVEDDETEDGLDDSVDSEVAIVVDVASVEDDETEDGLDDSVESEVVIDEDVTTGNAEAIVVETGPVEIMDASNDAVDIVVTFEDDFIDTVVDVCEVTKGVDEGSLSDELKDKETLPSIANASVVVSKSSLLGSRLSSLSSV